MLFLELICAQINLKSENSYISNNNDEFIIIQFARSFVTCLSKNMYSLKKTAKSPKSLFFFAKNGYARMTWIMMNSRENKRGSNSAISPNIAFKQIWAYGLSITLL